MADLVIPDKDFPLILKMVLQYALDLQIKYEALENTHKHLQQLARDRQQAIDTLRAEAEDCTCV